MTLYLLGLGRVVLPSFEKWDSRERGLVGGRGHLDSCCAVWQRICLVLVALKLTGGHNLSE